MPNWSAVLSSATIDGTGLNTNITIVITATNSLTQETQTRQYVQGNWTNQQVITLAQALIAALDVRDAALVVANNAIQSQTVLATG